MKGIAAQMIGDDRVWAIGVSFFLSKKPKPERPQSTDFLRGGGYKGQVISTQSFKFSSATPEITSYGGQHVNSAGGSKRRYRASGAGMQSTSAPQDIREVETEQLEIAAGAKISQGSDGADPNPLDFYQDSPHGIIYGNYCTVEDFNTIIEAGVVDRTAGGEGFMAGMETGNFD